MARPETLDADTIIGMYVQEGLEVRKIAERVGAPVGSVYAVLYRNGVELRPRRPAGPDPALDALIEEYFESTEPIDLITAKHGVSTGRLYRELGLRGLSTRKVKREAEMEELVGARLREALSNAKR